MNQIVECVPNFSEGRDPEILGQLVQTIESVPETAVLGTHMDRDHNRSVITCAGAPAAVAEAALRAVAQASELIDLRRHAGVHPRLGSTDVLPFVPVRGVTMKDCVALAHETGERIATQLRIPVYYYERAALRADRVRLEQVRRYGFELLRDRIANDPERAPDAGEARLHESAGAIAVGARPFLIAFNVNLATTDVSIARRIAHIVRERDGGLPAVKALGFTLESRHQVQVSMNLVDFAVTGMAQAFVAVSREASALGVGVASVEIVGLVPAAALDRGAEYFPLLEHFSEDLILENRLAARLPQGTA